MRNIIITLFFLFVSTIVYAGITLQGFPALQGITLSGGTPVDDALLLESGDFLLLETGDKLLLE